MEQLGAIAVINQKFT